MSDGLPLELILARNFTASLSVPAMLIVPGGAAVFYNESAGALLGVRFEELGRLEPEDWYPRFGPFTSKEGAQPPFDEFAMTLAVREKHEAMHAPRLYVKSVTEGMREVEASVLPLVTEAGYLGVIAFFWPVPEGETEPKE
jgi:hypothetical protein